MDKDLIENTFSLTSDEIARIIYPTLVRPHLEFASSVWNTDLEYDSKTLEIVQRRSTLTKESHRLPYKKRQETCNFTQIYKLVHGLRKINQRCRYIHYRFIYTIHHSYQP